MSNMMPDFKQVYEFVQHSTYFDAPAQVMADMAMRVINGEHTGVYLAMALTVQCLQQQHICCRLDEYAGTVLHDPEKKYTLHLPEWELWRASLQEKEVQAAVTVLSGKDESSIPQTLLVVDSCNGCYLQRQWSFERSIAETLLARAQNKNDLPELPAGFLHSLVKFFPTCVEHPEVDFQQLAVMAALRSKLLVLSGGPGTGKTTVAAGILAVKLAMEPDLRIMLAAPTAKAASRLIESLHDNLQFLQVDEKIKEIIGSLEAGTVQRVLGFQVGSHEFRCNRQNRLNCDLLLVDECSMVPQQLMARLLEALPNEAELILLGDKHQLSSVEAGAVFGDICDSARSNLADSVLAKAFKTQTQWQLEEVLTAEEIQHPLSGSVVELTENHRFDKSAPLLGRIAGVIRELKDDDDFELTANEIAALEGPEFEFSNLSDQQLQYLLRSKLRVTRLESGEAFADLPRLAAEGTEDARRKAFELLNTFKLLSPSYQGSRGIDKLNDMMLGLLALPDKYACGVPLLILQNDYRRGLFNGDTGLVALDENGEKRVFFENCENSFALTDLPEHEAVFAMSVHKSQGSGFDEVVFVMPTRSGELMTREMVYTAMTRAKRKLCCTGTVAVLADALKKRTRRMSDLTSHLCRK